MQMLTHRRSVAATLAAVLATAARIALGAPPRAPAGAFQLELVDPDPALFLLPESGGI